MTIAIWLLGGVVAALGYGAVMYRAGRAVEAKWWRDEDRDRERAMNDLAGRPTGPIQVMNAWKPCIVCHHEKAHTRACSDCPACSGEHIHLDCGNCHYRWIVQP